MSLEIPFYKNLGYRCAQVAMKSALSYLYPSKRFSYTVLDELTGRKEKEWTLFPQVAMGFLRLNLPFKYYTKRKFLENYLQSDPFEQFKKWCGPNANKIIKSINFQSLEEAIELILNTNSYAEIEPTLKVLEKELKVGNPILCAIDFMVANGAMKKEFKEHVVILTYIGSHNIYYHNSGPKNAMPNRKISKEQFLLAWENPSLLDYGTIIPICSQK